MLSVTNKPILEFLEHNNLNITEVTAREKDQNHCIAVTLITAKARVAPTKTESVSRLELMLSVIMLNVVMLSVVLLSVVFLSAISLSDVAPIIPLKTLLLM
jgi:Pao retrotransposon peptidase